MAQTKTCKCEVKWNKEVNEEVAKQNKRPTQNKWIKRNHKGECHTHLLIKIKRLIADGGLSGVRWPAEPRQQLWFEGDHVQTAEAQRQGAGHRGSVQSALQDSGPHRCCGPTRLTAGPIHGTSPRGRGVALLKRRRSVPRQRGSGTRLSACSDSSWPIFSNAGREEGRGGGRHGSRRLSGSNFSPTFWTTFMWL